MGMFKGKDGNAPVEFTDTITPELVESVKKQAKIFRAIADLGDVLEGISSIDGAVAESKKRLATSRGEESALKASISSLNDEISKLTDAKSEHFTRITNLTADATVDAKALVDNAKVKSSKIIADANGKADGIVTDANSRAQDVDAQTANARIQLTTVLADIENASSEYAKLQKAIDSLRLKFA